MSHSKEPWVASEHSPAIRSGKDMVCLLAPCGEDNSWWIAIANGRRIVACVNACAGISTEELERGTDIVAHIVKVQP